MLRIKKGGFSNTKIDKNNYAESPKMITFDNFFLLIFIEYLPEYKNKSISIISDMIINENLFCKILWLYFVISLFIKVF